MSCFYLQIFCFEKFSTWIWRLPYTWCLNSPRYFSLIKLYCLGLRKSRVCFVWWFIRRGCKISCQLEHEHLRSYSRVTRLNKLLFLFVLRKINMQCSLVLLFSRYPGRDPFNQNSDRSDREKRTTSKGGPVFSKLFRLDRTDPLSFGPKFPEILVEWIAPPCSPVTLFPNKSVESFPCSSVNLKCFTQMKRPHNSVNDRGIFTSSVSERLISIFHPLSSLS